MQINLQFSEREYLRGGASEIRFSEQKTKVFLSFSEREYLRGKASKINIFREIVAECPQKNFRFVSVCQRTR